jgi:cell shape-determining protein MreD
MLRIKKILPSYKLYLLLFILILLSHVPNLAGIFLIKPAILLMVIFLCSIFRQTRPNSLILILLGLIDDLLGAELIGLSSLNFVMASILASANAQALKKQRFNIVWMALAFSLALIYIVDAFILNMKTGKNYFTTALSMELLASILFYPLLHWLYFKNVHRLQD